MFIFLELDTLYTISINLEPQLPLIFAFYTCSLKTDVHEEDKCKKINILLLYLFESRISAGWCTRFIQSRIRYRKSPGNTSNGSLQHMYAMIPRHSVMKTYIIISCPINIQITLQLIEHNLMRISYKNYNAKLQLVDFFSFHFVHKFI